MSTGVDAQTCHLIVLDKRIASMTEFKQIIGRGTRINEDYGKLFFTIMDFRGATALFADPNFDGEPVQIYEPAPGDPPVPPDQNPVNPNELSEEELKGSAHDDLAPYGLEAGAEPGSRVTRYFVEGVSVSVAVERVQYLDDSGRLITESLSDYTRKTLLKNYASLDEFLAVWKDAEKKQAVVEALANQGVFLDELAEQVGREFDPFDLVCHIAFDRPPLTRRERADRVKKQDVFGRYEAKARAVLTALLDKYADSGIASMESLEILKVDPFRSFGTPFEIVALFGSKPAYLAALRDLETALYQEAA
jgi:type I restriction enzyme R subunit